MPNRLASEPSPYLLQHKDNPVDWYPWGEEAFARARAEDLPIFLSVGYSTCHWCHVMEHESFESPQVAEVLNRSFVSIKVDREERPDVDRVYMTFVQATTGAGGWPMSVWLTPALEPFYGGTYFPPTSRWGRPGFVDILQEIARVWRDERDKVIRSAGAIVERLRARDAEPGEGRPAGKEALDDAVQQFAQAFDAARGGFGDAPKFPRPSELLFLMREHARSAAPAPLDMAVVTLRAMALGGMRDHVGGGFHRYSVDGDWRVPHFEKMLYDQAQLTLAYVEAAQASGDAGHLAVALDTLDYVQRDMTHAEGGFFSAEDADSIPPEVAAGEAPHLREGAFYVWPDQEIGEALGALADIFRMRYGVLPGGNAPFDPQGEFTGRNLLYTARGLDAIAADTGRTPQDVASGLEQARLILRARRRLRPRPRLDDKVLTAWNGLMIAAFARASRLLAWDETPAEGRDVTAAGRGCLASARRAATFVRTHLWDEPTGRLLRRFRDGAAGVAAYAEDYASLIFGLVELFQADGDPAWLEWALTLQQRQDELFWDETDPGWFSTTGRDRSVLLRLKEDYDGAEPAASSLSVMNLLWLSHLVDDGAMAREGLPESIRWGTMIDRVLARFAPRVEHAARAVPMMLAAFSTYHAGVSQIVIVGDPGAADTAALRSVVAAHYLPHTVAVPVLPRYRQTVGRLLPWTATMRAQEGKATAFVCQAFACQQPTSSADELREQLRGLGAGRT
jgi:uncharacterized protein YyaL (SSP411 family)